jgi:hypothetical protein
MLRLRYDFLKKGVRNSNKKFQNYKNFKSKFEIKIKIKINFFFEKK